MYPHITFGIPSGYAQNTIILKIRPEVKVKVTQNGTGQYPTAGYLHTLKLGFPPQIMEGICSVYNYSKNIKVLRKRALIFYSTLRCQILTVNGALNVGQGYRVNVHAYRACQG